MASTMTLKDRLDIAAKDAEAAQEKITSGTLGREAFRQECATIRSPSSS